MFITPRLRLAPDHTRIQFMRGRIMGLVISAVLSTISVGRFFYPGLHLGIAQVLATQLGTDLGIALAFRAVTLGTERCPIFRRSTPPRCKGDRHTQHGCQH